MQRYSPHYGRKVENYMYLYSHNRENSLYNTAITEENLLDHQSKLRLCSANHKPGY